MILTAKLVDAALRFVIIETDKISDAKENVLRVNVSESPGLLAVYRVLTKSSKVGSSGNTPTVDSNGAGASILG